MANEGDSVVVVMEYELMVTVKATCAVWAGVALSATWTVKLIGPPRIAEALVTLAVAPTPPVPGLKVRPRLVSCVLPETSDHEYVPVPPVAASVCELVDPTRPLGS